MVDKVYSWTDLKLRQKLLGFVPESERFAEEVRNRTRAHFESRIKTLSSDVSRDPNDPNYKQGPKYRPDELWDVTSEIFQIIDSKTAALLTHISLMIAAISISSSVADNFPFTKSASAIFVTVYVATGYLCLRCLRFEIFGWYNDGQEAGVQKMPSGCI